ncbi:oxysterol-binding protein-related protein 2A isoform X1 [Ipomoea triloba]|uniref:oxysterol-binding protein-related protein 2A isoform X1 n=2 Tax=Ipomoea triloba TaxID=35885 RepID=UPI00125E058B|nr:oxysterol-binding protein-related protein 2A isoform X1 [Ipomoea triloba]
MRAREMHPLCCITLASGAIGDRSPEPAETTAMLLRTGSAVVGSDANAGGSEATSVAGVLYKWTNYHKGWRSRWFNLRNGVLSYSKTCHPDHISFAAAAADDVKLIGHIPSADDFGRRKHRKTIRIVHLKVSSFRESRSDDRRFYIFTATKTLHLRTNSRKEREAWIEALVSTRNIFMLRPANDNLSILPRSVSVSTEKLKKRLLDEGINEGLVKDCEQIMLSEFSEIQGQLQFLSEERSNLLDTLQQLEATNIETEASGVPDGDYQLLKREYPNLGRGKYSEWSTTESSDDVEKQELEEASDEEEARFFDTNDYFPEPSVSCELEKPTNDMMQKSADKDTSMCLQVERRKKLPDPIEKEKGVSLWSMIKDNVGKDLTRVCLPVYFNEPLSSLQRSFEDLEYSYLLDRAYKHGKEGNTLQRILNVAAFAVSGYASTEGRHCKPFNPLLGETYEADFPEKGIRFFSEKVSHHPTVIACHCEGRGWKFWGDSNLKSKFWGRSIQLDPVGTLTLEFDDGEIFQWSKVTTGIYNLILGKIYCDHHGIMDIRGNRQYSCKLKFKEQSLLDRNPHQVHGFVEDVSGTKVATLFGKWDESIYYLNGEWNSKPKDLSDASLLWKSNKPPQNLTRYNMSSFAITLNELTPGLKEKLPPTDSRLRPDQRSLENGEYDKANAEKLRLEMRQRMSRKLQENGWKPRWFKSEGEDGTFRYVGGYWETRENGKWDGCPDIFGQVDQTLINSFDGS